MDSRIKRMKDRASRGKVELSHTNSPKGGHILHGQYNTRYEVPTIPNEVCREIWRQPSKPKVQQKQVVHLFLEGALGRKCGVPGLPVPTAPQSPKPAYRGGTEVDPRYAPPESEAWHDGAVASSEAARLYSPSRKSIPCYAETGDVSSQRAKEHLQA